MPGLDDATNKAEQHAQDHPEKADEAKDKAKDFAEKREKGEQEQGDEKHPQ